MANFDNYTNYDKDSNFKSVVIGAGSKVLEVEMNEMQEIWFNTYQRLVRDFIGDGVLNVGTYTVNAGTLTIENESMLVNGYVIDIPHLAIAMQREDYAYLKVWEDVVDYTSPIYYKGNTQGTKTIENYIMDERVGEETSRRVQIRYTIVADPGELESTEEYTYLKIGQLIEEGFKLVAPIKGHNPIKFSERVALRDSQSIVTFSSPYVFGTNTLNVYLDGKFLVPGEDFFEVDSSTIRLSSLINVKAGQVLYAVSDSLVQPHPKTVGHGQSHLHTGEDAIDISQLKDIEGLIPKLRAIAGTLDISAGGFTDADVEVTEEYRFIGEGTGMNADNINVTDSSNFYKGYNAEAIFAEIGSKLRVLMEAVSSRTSTGVLHSPNGTAYTITVNDDGELGVTRVD